MTTFLADGNVLVALTVIEPVHHSVAVSWFLEHQPVLATCPITEATLLRFLLSEGRSAVEAIALLEAIRATDWHTFWPDVLAFEGNILNGVIGHRHVTDAYLVALARHNVGRLVTLDKGLATLHRESVHLLR